MDAALPTVVIMPPMCGIGGILRVDDQPIDPVRLRRMLDHLRHRGPDGEGVSDHGRCSLVHARLSVIDPRWGQQPMHLVSTNDPGDDSRCGLHLVFNGEIYNHRQLRKQLEQRGHTFRSDHSDTEVLLYAYRQWGTQLLEHLRGMYALALWDEAQQRLFLARDPTGMKPLYLRRTGREVAFASLAAALVIGDDDRAGTGSGQIDAEAMGTFLRFGYTFPQSLIRGVEELPPAHWMTVDANGRTRIEQYWRPPSISKTIATPKGRAALDELREVLGEAVAHRLEADVPLACFLSGGIDSSLIAAMAQAAMTGQRPARGRHALRGGSARGGGPLRTFSVAMPGTSYDESVHARTVANHIGSRHTVLDADPTHALEDLKRLMAVIGEPTADSSLLPTYWLCKATRAHVKVALSGDGGDELFGGYDRYRALRLLRHWRPLLAAAPTAWLDTPDPRSKRTRLRRLAEAARAGRDPARQYQQMIHLFSEAQVRELGFAERVGGKAGKSRRGPSLPDWSDAVSARGGSKTGEGAGGRGRAAQQWDLTHYLPYDLLRKVDRASMAVALEVRCPLLDARVVDLAGRLPARVLTPGGRPKGLLRALASDYLPAKIVKRPKRGFAVPIGDWFRTSLKDPLADLLTDGTLEGMGFNPAPIRRLFEAHTTARTDHTHRLFALLQLSLWGRWMREPIAPDLHAPRA